MIGVGGNGDPAASLIAQRSFFKMHGSPQMQQDDVWYLVDAAWYRDWRTAMDDGESDTPIACVNNARLVDDEGELLPNLCLNSNYEFVSEAVWTQLEEWYPGSGPAIKRSVIVANFQATIEVYPVTIVACTEAACRHGETDKATFSISKATTMGKVLRQLCRHFGVHPNRHLWIMSDGQKLRECDNSEQTLADEGLVGEVELMVGEPVKNQPGDCEMEEFVTIDLDGDATKSGAATGNASDEDNGPPLFAHGYGGYARVNTPDDGDDGDVDEPAARNGGGGIDERTGLLASDSESDRELEDQVLLVGQSRGSTGAKVYGSSSTSSKSSAITIPARGADTIRTLGGGGTRSSSRLRDPYDLDDNFGSGAGSGSGIADGPIAMQPLGGLKGLRNIGNTCFMNSALQCLSNSPELTKFFLSGDYEKDLNPDNPLGLEGKLASAFASLVRQIWGGPESVTCINPQDLKTVIGRFAPQFTGYNQHDSQELLAFLLDGIHEDLNRVHDKPPTENLVGDGTNDVAAAAESWRRHLQRHQSIIVDHFQASFRSELTCPGCKKVSMKFDPYMYLTVHLPEDNAAYFEVKFVPSDPTRQALEVGLSLSKHATIGDAKSKLSELFGVPAGNMLCCDVYRGKVYAYIGNKKSLNSHSNDELYFYETSGPVVPQNTPEYTNMVVSRSKRPSTPTGEQSAEWMHCVVMHRYKDRFQTTEFFGWPMIVSFPRDHPHTGDEVIAEIGRHARRFYTEPAGGDDNAMVDDGDGNSDSEPDCTSTTGGQGQRPFSVLEITPSRPQRVEPTSDVDIETAQGFFVDWASWSSGDAVKRSSQYQEHDSVRSKPVSGGAGVGKEQVSLTKCLESFIQPEVLGSDDCWRCPGCKELVQARKRMNLWSLPDVLIVHLKRFSHDGGYWRDKLETFVDFPLTDLDVAPYLARPVDKPVLYDLYAVSNHFGSSAFGHYTAFAKPQGQDDWYEYNDSFVRKTSESQVVSEGGYVLFYRRQSELPPELRVNSRLDNTTTDSEGVGVGGGSGANSDEEVMVESQGADSDDNESIEMVSGDDGEDREDSMSDK